MASSLSGCYDVKSGYAWLRRNHFLMSDENFTWKWVWRLPTTEKCRFTVRIICHGAPPTNKLRNARGLGSSICGRCHMCPESDVHCLRDCMASKRIWMMLGFHNHQDFFIDDAKLWVQKNAEKESGVLFLATLWCLWVTRNNDVINNHLTTDSAVIWNIMQLEKDCASVIGHHAQHQRHPVWVCWKSPMTGFVKLNTDGSVQGTNGSAGIGGIIRDYSGEWIVGFKGYIGSMPILLVKLKAIQQGLILARQGGYVRVMCESDSMEAIRLVLEADEPYHHYGAIVANIRRMMKEEWEVSLNHVYKQANFCADFLAKSGAAGDDSFVTLLEDPIDMHPLMLADALETPMRHS